MADEKISQLSDAGAPQDTDQLVIARSGSSLSLLFSALKAAIPGGVTSVFTRTGAVTAQTGDYTAAQVGALPSTETLDQIATANATAANVAMNSHKLTGLAAGSVNGDSLRYEQLISLYLLLTGGTMSGAIAMGSNKITGLTNGSAASDAAAFGQIPTALPPNGTAGGDLSGTYPNPAVAKITETSGPTDLTIGTITDGQFLKRTGSTLVSGAVMSNPLTTKGDIVIEDASPAPARLAIGATGQRLAVVSGLPAWTFPPGYELDYVENTAGTITITSTSGGTSGGQQIILGNAVTYDGSTRIKIEFYTPNAEITTAQSVLADIYEGTTDLGQLCVVSGPGGTNDMGMYGARFLTPSAGSHTYQIRAWKSGGTAKIITGTGGSGLYMPAFMRITVA